MANGQGGYTVQEAPLQEAPSAPSSSSSCLGSIRSTAASLWGGLGGALQSAAISPLLAFLRASIKVGVLLLRSPDGTETAFGDPSAPAPYRARLRVHSWNFYLRVSAEADLGLARSFMAGEWTCDDLTGLFNIFIANRERAALSNKNLWTAWLGMALNYASFAFFMDNSIAGSRKNIFAHYDLSNDLFVSFLDRQTLMYSCGFFDTTRAYVREVDLSQAVTLAAAFGGGGEAAAAASSRSTRDQALANSTSSIRLPFKVGSAHVAAAKAAAATAGGSAASSGGGESSSKGWCCGFSLSSIFCCKRGRGSISQQQVPLLPAYEADAPTPFPTSSAAASSAATAAAAAASTRMELRFNGTLEEAQLRKLDHLIARSGATKADRVLDLGFGWGGLSIRLAETVGCRVHGITLSREQFELASERVKQRGLEHLITFEIVDYRVFAAAHPGEFDKIISVEMIEAVGINYMDTYFAALDTLLAPNGIIVIQAITIPESRFAEYAKTTDFINTIIFPGGALPCLALIMSSIQKGTQLALHSTEDFGLHYGETLRRWRANFNAALESVVRPLGFDDAFIRCWNYYFTYCEAGFSTQTLGLHVLTFTRPGNTSLITTCPSRPLAKTMGPIVNDVDHPLIIPAGSF